MPGVDATGQQWMVVSHPVAHDAHDSLGLGRLQRLDDVVDSARRYGITWQLFDDFLGAMRMDLVETDYADRAALTRYMYGSAEVIGLQMLPILGTVAPPEEAAPYAAPLGRAFQLTLVARPLEDAGDSRFAVQFDEAFLALFTR